MLSRFLVSVSQFTHFSMNNSNQTFLMCSKEEGGSSAGLSSAVLSLASGKYVTQTFSGDGCRRF